MFNAIVSLCENHGLLRKLIFPKMNIDQLKVGPVGCLLLQNLRNEWLYSTVLNKDTTVFLSDNSDFKEAYEFAKKMCLETLPFGIAEVLHHKKPSSDLELIEYYNERMNNSDIDFGKLFANEDCVKLKCTVFTSATNSIQFFHQWQRERRIWWRKFSADPGRYSITDIKTEENDTQKVHIVAKYPWKSQVVETLTFNPKPNTDKFKEGRKLSTANSVVSHIDMNTMFVNTICDAYDNSVYKGKSRTLLRFHRKLAPYSISFAISAQGMLAATLAELSDLALYLTKQLRAKHISTLLLPGNSKFVLDAQWRQYDELGIPYVIYLNENTLKDGLALLRSRDTTLKEQVHVSELVAYVEQLFKNY